MVAFLRLVALCLALSPATGLTCCAAAPRALRRPGSGRALRAYLDELEHERAASRGPPAGSSPSVAIADDHSAAQVSELGYALLPPGAADSGAKITSAATKAAEEALSLIRCFIDRDGTVNRLDGSL